MYGFVGSSVSSHDFYVHHKGEVVAGPFSSDATPYGADESVEYAFYRAAAWVAKQSAPADEFSVLEVSKATTVLGHHFTAKAKLAEAVDTFTTDSVDVWVQGQS